MDMLYSSWKDPNRPFADARSSWSELAAAGDDFDDEVVVVAAAAALVIEYSRRLSPQAVHESDATALEDLLIDDDDRLAAAAVAAPPAATASTFAMGRPWRATADDEAAAVLIAVDLVVAGNVVVSVTKQLREDSGID